MDWCSPKVGCKQRGPSLQSTGDFTILNNSRKIIKNELIVERRPINNQADGKQYKSSKQLWLKKKIELWSNGKEKKDVFGLLAFGRVDGLKCDFVKAIDRFRSIRYRWFSWVQATRHVDQSSFVIARTCFGDLQTQKSVLNAFQRTHSVN